MTIAIAPNSFPNVLTWVLGRTRGSHMHWEHDKLKTKSLTYLLRQGFSPSFEVGTNPALLPCLTSGHPTLSADSACMKIIQIATAQICIHAMNNVVCSPSEPGLQCQTLSPLLFLAVWLTKLCQLSLSQYLNCLRI